MAKQHSKSAPKKSAAKKSAAPKKSAAKKSAAPKKPRAAPSADNNFKPRYYPLSHHDTDEWAARNHNTNESNPE